MREIKFRVWDIKHKKYTEYRIDNSGFYCMDNFTGCWLKMNNTHFNFIIMQYTGLKDKNGKDIYEGDVLRGWGTYDILVDIKGGHAIIKWFDDEPVEDYLINTYIDDDGLEVIGNIYENPELLEVDNGSKQ